MNQEEHVLTMKVSATTVPGLLARAISKTLIAGKTVHLETIGWEPNYIATKALILSRARLIADGKSIQSYPTFAHIVFDGSDGLVKKTGIIIDYIYLRRILEYYSVKLNFVL